MQARSFSLIRKLARDFRYQTVQELLDLPVLRPDVDRLAESVLQAVADRMSSIRLHIPEDYNPQNKSGVLSKYGYCDLEFEVTSMQEHAVAVGGIPLLEELGFLHREDILGGSTSGDDAGDDFCDDLDLLKQLWDDMQSSQIYLLVWVLDARLAKSTSELMAVETLVTGGRPEELIIKDACLTNSTFCWFEKHFYW